MSANENQLGVKRPGLFVIGSGVITSILTLITVFLIGVIANGYQIMGLYANYIIPVGAVLVGLMAGSGYGVASWISGLKIGRGLLWTVVFLQVIVYFSAKYIEFKQLSLCYPNGEPVSFPVYYDSIIRSFSWTQKDGTPGEPLGIWGYLFNLLEVSGFALGGLIIPAILFKRPYCSDCQIYMKMRDLCFIPAGVIPRKIKKKDDVGKAVYEEDILNGLRQGSEDLNGMRLLAESGQGVNFTSSVESYKQKNKETSKLTAKIAIKLVFCKCCFEGHLEPILIVGQGENANENSLEKISLQKNFIKGITQ